MSHEALITGRQSILQIQGSGPSEGRCWLVLAGTGCWGPPLPGFAKKKKCFVFWLSGPHGTSNFDNQSLIHSDLNYTNGGNHHWITVYQILNWRTSNIRCFSDSRWLRMTWDKNKWLRMTQDSTEHSLMSHYEFRWIKSTAIALCWGPLDLDISIYSGSVTS